MKLSLFLRPHSLANSLSKGFRAIGMFGIRKAAGIATPAATIKRIPFANSPRRYPRRSELTTIFLGVALFILTRIISSNQFVSNLSPINAIAIIGEKTNLITGSSFVMGLTTGHDWMGKVVDLYLNKLIFPCSQTDFLTVGQLDRPIHFGIKGTKFVFSRVPVLRKFRG